MDCVRCLKADRETAASRMLAITDVVDETPEGELILSNHDAWTEPLCMSCASEAQKLLERFIVHERG